MLVLCLEIANFECYNGGVIVIAFPSYGKEAVSGSHDEMGRPKNPRTCQELRRLTDISYIHTKSDNFGASKLAGGLVDKSVESDSRQHTRTSKEARCNEGGKPKGQGWKVDLRILCSSSLS
jgi:hypothetical protein